jgi:staphylococcal nuclease domain-containing protein 1
VILPKQDVKITLVLSGIRAPRTARNPSEKSEPYGQEAYDFAVRRALQRDVEVSVQDIDRSGGASPRTALADDHQLSRTGFIGAIYLSKTENYAAMMVREGLASVNEYSASQTSFGKELLDAETEAKAARKHVRSDAVRHLVRDARPDHAQMWSTFDSAAEEAAKAAQEQAAAPPAARREYVDIMLSDVRPDPFSISVQILHDGGIAELSQLMSDFAIHHQDASCPPGWQPKVAELVSAKFSEDGQWYRAKVRKVVLGKKTADVVFHDYGASLSPSLACRLAVQRPSGNSETLPFDALRPLPDSFRKLPAQSHEAVPSFIKLAGFTSDYGQEAVERFRALTEGRPLVANVSASFTVTHGSV